MANLSQLKREKMLNFLNKIRAEHQDDETLMAINEIENALTEKKYGLVWEEHIERVDEEMIHNIPVFTEIENRKIKNLESNDYNFLIEGDNLHSLKLLEKTHKGKIDIIYIDPPYNTNGKDFIYNDSYVDKEDNFKHSKWLSFMKNRLIIARELLSEKGLIFISIDDYEDAQLKLLCDEIFGYNFINKFIWKRNSSSKTEKGKFTVNTEYLYLYSKTKNYILNNTYKPLAESSAKMFNKDDGDGRGKYSTVSLQKPKDPGPETTYDYIDNTGKVWKCPPKGWRMTYAKLKNLENDNRLYFEGKRIREKKYWNERENEGKRIDTLWNDISENTAGSKELERIFNQKGIFDNPKPIALIKRCLEIGNKNAIILDFFTGSGTTGQTVIHLNKEDGGNRKYILCTNNENNICEEVTYQRLSKIQDEFPHNLKYFKTEFIPKFSEDEESSIKYKMLNYVKELIELEYMCEIDGINNILIKDEEEFDEIVNESMKENIRLFVSSDIFASKEQQLILEQKNIKKIEIPEYYYRSELREVGEL